MRSDASTLIVASSSLCNLFSFKSNVSMFHEVKKKRNFNISIMINYSFPTSGHVNHNLVVVFCIQCVPGIILSSHLVPTSSCNNNNQMVLQNELMGHENWSLDTVSVTCPGLLLRQGHISEQSGRVVMCVMVVL